MGKAKPVTAAGRSTLIARALWPAVDVLARNARERLQRAPGSGAELRFLARVEREPGVAGSELRASLGLDARGFQRIKGRLEQRLCLYGLGREDLDHHSHESCWFPWADSKLARGAGRRRRPDAEAALEALLAAVYPEGPPSRSPRPPTLFPVLR